MRFSHHAQAVVAVCIVLALALFSSVIIVTVMQGGRSARVEIDEHRRFNQADHEAICLYLRDAAVENGRPVYPCGSTSR